MLNQQVLEREIFRSVHSVGSNDVTMFANGKNQKSVDENPCGWKFQIRDFCAE